MQLPKTKNKTKRHKRFNKEKRLHIDWFLDNKLVSSDEKETEIVRYYPPGGFQLVTRQTLQVFNKKVQKMYKEIKSLFFFSFFSFKQVCWMFRYFVGR